MKFSIITIVLNNLAGLRATADSLRGQTRGIFEWIVVDGRSEDGTLEALSEFDGLMDDFQTGADAGLYDAMNKGLLRAAGDYVLFLNGGDLLMPGVLQQVYDQLLSDGAAHYNLIFGDVLLRLPNGQARLRPALEAKSHIWHRMPTSHQSTFIARKAHLELPYDLRFPVSSDYYVISKIYKSQPSGVLNLGFVVSETPIGGQSFSAQHPLQMLIDHNRIQTEVLGVAWLPKWLSLLRKTMVLGGIWLSQYWPLGARHGG